MIVKKDNIVVFVGTTDECWIYIHTHQSSSVTWAIKYEGWSIEEDESEL